jgi:hypothetical protein
MKRSRLVNIPSLFLLSICLASCMKAPVPDTKVENGEIAPKNLSEGIRSVDQYSRKATGVGIDGLSLLLRSGPRVFFRQDSMSPTELSGLTELQTEKLVTIKAVDSRDGVYLQIEPTFTGVQMKTSIEPTPPALQ